MIQKYQGRFPSGRSFQSVLKRNAQVLRIGSGQNGPAQVSQSVGIRRVWQGNVRAHLQLFHLNWPEPILFSQPEWTNEKQPKKILTYHKHIDWKLQVYCNQDNSSIKSSTNWCRNHWSFATPFVWPRSQYASHDYSRYCHCKIDRQNIAGCFLLYFLVFTETQPFLSKLPKMYHKCINLYKYGS